jgi:hypothetical protein
VLTYPVWHLDGARIKQTVENFVSWAVRAVDKGGQPFARENARGKAAVELAGVAPSARRLDRRRLAGASTPS